MVRETFRFHMYHNRPKAVETNPCKDQGGVPDSQDDSDMHLRPGTQGLPTIRNSSSNLRFCRGFLMNRNVSLNSPVDSRGRSEGFGGPAFARGRYSGPPAARGSP